MRALIGEVVDASGRRPWRVLGVALLVLVVTWWLAARVLSRPHTDLRDLLPTGSPGLVAFAHQYGRIGGGASIVVVAQSPDRTQNERFVDDLAVRLDALRAAGQAGSLIAYVESDTREVREFYEKSKWLYAGEDDLTKAEEAIDHQLALRSGLVEDLDDGDRARTGVRPALGLDPLDQRWRARLAGEEPFPHDHFESDDGSTIALRIVTETSGLGEAAGDVLLAAVERAVAEMRPTSYQPAMTVGFAGDIPNAAAERDSVVSQAAWASLAAGLLILGGVAWFFRSTAALVIVGLPALLGVGAAYAFAYLRFGYVNTTGLFLGAIIVGNGVNYPIILLARYREFRARGDGPAAARRSAVQNALRAELVGACVASIAYGSLTITAFRGFNQFGWIGFFGMLFVWAAMIPCVPALLALLEPREGAARPAAWLGTGRARRIGDAIARTTGRAPWLVLVLAGALTAAALWRAPAFLSDPWEYNFDHLGSRESKHGGAGEWSNKADAVFRGRTNLAGALMLADTPEQVPLVKAQILANDAADPQGSLLAGVTTIADRLPGTRAEQERKLQILGRIRDRLTPAVLAMLSPEERARVEALRPPADLRVVAPEDLPSQLRRPFEEKDGRLGTVFYVRFRDGVSLSDGHNLLRIARATDDVRLPSGVVVETASRATIFAEMIRSMRRDGPRATVASLLAVVLVVLVATHDVRGASVVLASLTLGVVWLLGGAAWLGEKLNYVNFIVLPITFGIGCEYPFNVYDRSRLLGGDVDRALDRVGGAVALCSYTTVVGYGSLLFADFQALRSFGRLAVAGELASVVGALALVPALLRVSRPRSVRWPSRERGREPGSFGTGSQQVAPARHEISPRPLEERDDLPPNGGRS